MKREDAIARFGHHYVINTYNGTVYEALGPAQDDDASHMTDPEEALEELKNRLADRAMERITQIDRILGRPGNAVQMWLAQRGWHKRAEKINGAVAKLRTESAALHKDIAADFEGRATLEPLPAEIKIPVQLEKGQKIFISRACYLDEGIKTSTATVTGTQLWSGSFARGDWDYITAYTATDENGKTFTFEYNKGDTTDPEIPNNIHGTRYFLTQDALDDHVLALASKMIAHFSAVALDTRLRVIARPRKEDTAQKPTPPQP